MRLRRLARFGGTFAASQAGPLLSELMTQIDAILGSVPALHPGTRQ